MKKLLIRYVEDGIVTLFSKILSNCALPVKQKNKKIKKPESIYASRNNFKLFYTKNNKWFKLPVR